MAINLIEKTSPLVAERLFKESVTEGLASREYSFTGAKSINVLSVDNVPLTAYNDTLTVPAAAGTIGKRFGNITELGDTKNTYTMTDKVKYNIGIDETVDCDQDEIKKSAGKIIGRQTREIVIPYMDKYRIEKMAAGAGIQKTSVAAADFKADKVLRTLMTYRAELRNHLAPVNQQVLFVSETDYIELALANQVIGCDRTAEKPIVNGVIEKLAGMQLKTVPDDYMPEGLKFLIVTKGSVWMPEKIKKSRVITDPEDYAGQLIQFLMYHDCFVNEVRKNTLLAAWTTAGPAA